MIDGPAVTEAPGRITVDPGAVSATYLPGLAGVREPLGRVPEIAALPVNVPVPVPVPDGP